MNGKIVGAEYEREWCKKLSSWITGSDDELVVWRNIHSGTVGTVRRKKGLSEKNVCGDVQCLNPKYQSFFDLFFIDTKTYKDFNPFFINQSNRKSNDILNQWIKVCSDCPSTMVPMMPCKIRDRSTDEFIIFPLAAVIRADDRLMIGLNTMNRMRFQLILQEDFFSNNTWEEMVKENALTKNA